MKKMNNILTKEDITRLSLHPDAETKSGTVQKIGVYYNDKNITEKGRQIAESIFRIVVRDVELKVREALSESLKNSKKNSSRYRQSADKRRRERFSAVYQILF